MQNSGIASLFPVQVAVWQETVGPGSFERDLCINSPTGSGKTLAYALPIVQMLSTRAVKCLRALVVLPTRDLALQVKALLCCTPSENSCKKYHFRQSSQFSLSNKLTEAHTHEHNLVLYIFSYILYLISHTPFFPLTLCL